MTVDWRRRIRAASNPAVMTGYMVAAGMTAVMLLAACGGKGGQKSTSLPTPTALAAAPTPTASTAATASGTSTCMSQFTNWRELGGDANITALTNALTDFTGSEIDASLGVLSHANVAQLKTTAASIQAAAKRGQAHPPPSCVPGLRAHHKAAMTNFKNGAQGALDAVQIARSGDMLTAATKIKAAASKIDAASKALDAAVQDMQAFTASG